MFETLQRLYNCEALGINELSVAVEKHWITEEQKLLIIEGKNNDLL